MPSSRRLRADAIERHRGVWVGVALAIVLTLVLSPGPPAWRNDIRWLEPGPGLYFKNLSQALSEAPIVSTTGEFTLEVFLVPGFTPGVKNQEIISFHDDEMLRPLTLGQFPSGFILRGRADNPSGDPRNDRYVGIDEVGLAAPDELQHLAVTVGERGARLHVNGRATELVLPETVPGLGEPFGGHLVIASSNTGWGIWHGKMKGIAIYDRLLTQAELRDHAHEPTRLYGLPLLQDESLLALYRFEEGEGRRTHSALVGAPDLLFPDRMLRPTRPNFLAYYSFGRTDRSWLPSDIFLNLLLFAPLGFLIAWKKPDRTIVFAFACGFALSLGIEVAQAYVPGRASSLTDVASNGFGALLGALLTRFAHKFLAQGDAKKKVRAIR